MLLCRRDDGVLVSAGLESALAGDNQVGHGSTVSEVTTFDFGVEGPVQAEAFVLYLESTGVALTGPCGAEPWYIDLADGDDPVETVTRLVRANVGEPVVVHSTSWRAARDGVILSFAVVIDAETAAAFESTPIGRAELARSEATKAPASIQTNQVVEHALRHLAWLAKDDPIVAERLPADWKRALDDYEPQPFRNLR